MLAYQDIDLFSNRIICDLAIRFQVSPAYLVLAVLDTYIVLETKAFLEDENKIKMKQLNLVSRLK